VTAILRDRLGDLYIGTHQGLNRFNPETNQFTHFKHEKNNFNSLSSNQVRELFESKNGTLWVGTGSPYADNGGGPEDGGLNKFDKKSGTFTRYLHDPNDTSSLGNNKICAIYEDDQGVFWIGTARNMIHKMDRTTGTFERMTYDPEHPENLGVPDPTEANQEYDHITFITQDSSGRYWYGTVSKGVFSFEVKQSKINRYQNSEIGVKGFENTGAWSAFSSRDGIFWLGGMNLGGIYRVNPNRIKIDHIPITSGVNSIYKGSNGDLWIATNINLLVKSKNGQIADRAVKDLEPDRQHDNWFAEIKDDKEGSIWVGGYNGLNRWDNRNNEFVQYFNGSNGIDTPQDHMVTSILRDIDDILWVGTVNGLSQFDEEAGEITRFFLNKRDTINPGFNVVSDVFKDRRGQLWVGMFNGAGLYQFNPKTLVGKNYLDRIDVLDMYQDQSGVLWVGTSDGLYSYSENDDRFFRFTNPFLNNAIFTAASILEDDQQDLWITSSIGLVQINQERDQVSIFDYASGISNYDFSWSSGFKDVDGKFYFGDDKGYIFFDPNVLKNQIKAPEIRITGFRLSDEDIFPDEKGPLKEDLSQVKTIELGYDQNVFSFDFTNVDYTNPEKNKIFYYLENYDKNWSGSNAENRAYYFNVPPGKYMFHIKGSKGYGPWAEKQIEIIISPPWWQTWWAYVAYTILFGLGIFTFHRFMKRRLIRIERERSREKDLKQAKEIEKAYKELKSTQAQLIQSEKMASLGELTAGIAHEIQNPLNFVNNFSEVNTELLEELEAEVKKGDLTEIASLAKDIKSNEQKIIQHGKRADAIVKGMLQHSRTSSGQKEFTNINALTDEFLRLAYHGLRAKDKSFNAKFETDFDASIDKVNIVAQDIGRVILNLINNAFYAVNDRKKLGEEGYEPTVVVGTKKLGDDLEISVKDNGKGIPSEIMEKIFQPFFTSKPTGEGTGLGLSLSYDIVKAHGGEIKVESNDGGESKNAVEAESGTRFTIILPMG
jgi:signal transduction histidine kinase/ligand-binding sensor domain-containing protein